MKKMKSLLALCCALLMVLGMAPVGFAAGTPTSEGDIMPYSDTNHPYDVAVMTFNILGDNSGTARYDTPANRVDRIVGLIENYSPDVVNLQEVYMDYYVDAARTISWHDVLAEKLSAKGYGFVSPANIEGASAARSSALMIAYKKNRFTAGENGWGSLQVEVSYNGYTGGKNESKDRCYIWTELMDRDHGNAPIYCFNTHFPYEIVTDINGNTIPTNDTSTTRRWISSLMHGEQAVIVANAVKSVAGNHPFFIGGDFNTGLEESYEDKYFSKLWGGKWNSLLRMTDTYSAIQPAVRVSKRVLSTDIYGTNQGTAWTGIDHIFLNNNMLVTTDYQTLSDHVDGRRPSDHLPRIAYCSYRPALTISAGEYDKWEGTYEHTVNTATFAPTLTLPAGVTYSLGEAGTTSLNLTKYKNTFDINLYNNGAFYDSIYATVYNTAAIRPTLTVAEAENVYFANHAYQVVLDKDVATISPKVSGGTLYVDPSCSEVVETLTPAAGRTELCIRSDAGEFIPVYIYKESASAAAKTAYIEDDTKGATGTVAFYDGENVILGTAGTEIFGDFPDVVNGLNNGTFTTAILAGGEYNGNNSSTVTGTALSADVTILGNNADVEANLRESKEWKLNPARKEETVLHGALRYRFATSTADAKVSVSGCTFVGQANYGSIFVDEARGSVNNTTTLNIQNNIFRGSGYQWNSAAIYINNAPQKMGTIKGNLFMVEGNLVLSENDSYNYGSLYYRRGIFGRNINGLNIEENRFVGFTMALWLSSEAASGNTTTAAHATYTVKNNRFEHCDHLELYVQNVSSATASHIKFIGNDFLRGATTGLDEIYLQYIETGIGVDFGKCSLEMKDNNFIECMESVYISRSKNDATALAMPLSITGNRFIPNDQHNQRNYLGKTLDINFGLNGAAPTNWDLSHNYFSADYYIEGETAQETNNNYITPDVHDPALFINTNSKWALSRSLYAPYYSDYEMSALICDHDWAKDFTVDVEPTCGEAGSKSIHCTLCGEKKDVTAIPATGEHGELEYVVKTPATTEAEGLAYNKCTVCGKQVGEDIILPKTGVAVIGDKSYATLEEALAAAKANDTVKLNADVTVDYITIDPAVTLDLNGKTLTADYVIGFNGSVIGGEGKLIVKKDKVALDLYNDGYLPVHDGEGYKFIKVTMQEMRETDAETGETYYYFSPDLSAAHEELLKGAASSGVKIVVRLSWSKAGNYTATQDFVYMDGLVKTVIDSYGKIVEYPNHYADVFKATFEGTEAGEAADLKISAVLISATGVELASTGISFAG